MQTHSQTTHLAMPVRTIPGRHAKGTRRSNTPSDAAHRIVITGLLLAGLAAGSAAMSGYATGHLTAHDLMAARPIVDTPWMY